MEDNLDRLLAPMDDEDLAVEDIIDRFRATLKDPDRQSHVLEFHLGITAEDIVWDDSWLTPTYSGNSVITVCIDINELTSGEYQQITPEGIDGLMFRNGHAVAILDCLRPALHCERLYDREGGDQELYEETCAHF